MALAATVAYSLNSPVAKAAISAGMEPITLVVARFPLGALLFGATLSLTRLGQPTGDQKPLDRKALLIGFGSGIINGCTLAALFGALRYIDASVSAVLSIALIQLFTLGLLTLRGEPITQRHLIRLGLSLAGLYLLFGLQGGIDARGIMLIGLGSLLFSIHIVSVQWYLSAYNTWSVTTLLVTSASVIVILLWWISGAPTYIPGWIGWMTIAVQVLIATYIGRILTYGAIQRIGSGQFALLSPLETALTVLWSVLFLGERLGSSQWAGTGLILVSALLAAQFKGKR